ncbi:MAG: hypothetical protein ACXVKN_17475 [Acidimicrobiia bacterium]
MKLQAGRVVRIAAGCAGLFLLTGCGLTSCGNGTSNQGFNQTVVGEHGSKSSVRFGADAKIPADFPKGVPLPIAGRLRSIVSEQNPPNASYTMTYALGGRDGIVVGNDYRSRLQKAGYKIQNYSSVGGSDGQIVQYDAIGKKWDVAVVSGKANPRDRATMSVQVHTHGQLTSGIGGIGDTTPSVTAPSGAPGVLVPDPSASTTTTTFGL